MPYFVFQRLQGVNPALQNEEGAMPILVGLNVRPVEMLVVKLEYTWVGFSDWVTFPAESLEFIGAQVAWAF
jgi:hypothetical protein